MLKSALVLCTCLTPHKSSNHPVCPDIGQQWLDSPPQICTVCGLTAVYLYVGLSDWSLDSVTVSLSVCRSVGLSVCRSVAVDRLTEPDTWHKHGTGPASVRLCRTSVGLCRLTTVGLPVGLSSCRQRVVVCQIGAVSGAFRQIGDAQNMATVWAPA